MAKTLGKKKINQSDLRRLMSERTASLTTSEKNIESPLAKYNSSGRLSCIACNEFIKDGTLWRHHILSKNHKKNINEKLKRKNTEPDGSLSHEAKKEKKDVFKVPFNHPRTTNNVGKDRDDNAKKIGNDSSEKAGVNLLQEYSSSEDEENDETPTSSKANVSQAPLPNGLPSDFFDASGSVDTALGTPSNPVASHGPVEVSEVKNTQEALPEGFFDDPFADAQARKVEYKDPKEEEWEKFQRTIAEETNVSQSIMEEDIQQSIVERDIGQIEEEMQGYSRVIAVQKKIEDRKITCEISSNKKDIEMMEVSPNSDSEDDEHLLEELFDWRTKKMW